MRIHALIPVKELANAKSRLTPPFSGHERAALMLEMLGNVIAAAQASGEFARITVVSPDTTVLDFAEARGVATLRQHTTGLNPALDEARTDALAHGAEAVLALHADLPHLHPPILRRWFACCRRRPPPSSPPITPAAAQTRS